MMVLLNLALLYFCVSMTMNAFRLELSAFLIALPMMAGFVCALFVIRALLLGL